MYVPPHPPPRFYDAPIHTEQLDRPYPYRTTAQTLSIPNNCAGPNYNRDDVHKIDDWLTNQVIQDITELYVIEVLLPDLLVHRA